MIIKCQVSVSSLLLNVPNATFPRVLKTMAQSTRNSQRTSAEEREADMRYLFLQIMCSLSNCVNKSQLASDMLHSCKQFKYRDYFSKYWQFYWYVWFKALLYRLSQYYTWRILFSFITLTNKSFKTCVGKVQNCLESILFQYFDIYFCFPILHVHPSIMN